MPTARELLEQADALMRRNRQDAAQGTRSPPGRTQVPATEPTSAEDRPRAAQEAEIPVLDEIVVAPVPEPQAAGDDFPVLTDAVDEIDVALPASLDGEPSDWLVALADDQSVLGPSPPSVALVPSVDSRAPRPPAPVQAQSSQPPTEPAPQPAMPAMPELEDFDLESLAADEPPITVVRTPAGPPPATPVAAPPASWLEELIAEVPVHPERARQDAVPSTPPAEPPRPLPGEVREPRETPPVVVPEVPPPEGVSTPAPASPPEGVSAPTPASPPRDESWEALAEEIRMQVLQRIDLFTDTGLRDRLGERLKPIVDRASADLVATINQHVGELLRAYVAEAIEREIERWRAGR